VKALIREMEMRVSDFCADTLYIGGGTPTVLPPHAVEQILAATRRCFPLLPHAEITIEANPGTIRLESLKAYRGSGVNRISLGFQSFRDEILEFLGRVHSVQEGFAALEWAREAGFDNIGLDLIYGVPGQTLADWETDLKQAAALGPDHLSCYMLTWEPGTPLDDRRRRGEAVPLPDDIAGDLFDLTADVLESLGYERYEISNFSRSKETRSRHNQKYWNGVPYLGLGPSAHSFLHPKRFWNHRCVTEYIQSIEQGHLPLAGSEVLTREQQIIEAIYTGLRKQEGIVIPDFEERFALCFDKVFETDRFQTEGWIKADAVRCALTPKGMRFLDSIVSLLVCQDF
jgi:oxygen-independent coproporphyrinogen-3 oxidase